MTLKDAIDKVVKLVQQFNDGELSYQALDNELHNIYADERPNEGVVCEHEWHALVDKPEVIWCVNCGVKTSKKVVWPEKNDCPICDKGKLVFHKSSFEQYQPSVYKCDNCSKEFSPREFSIRADVIDAFMSIINLQNQKEG